MSGAPARALPGWWRTNLTMTLRLLFPKGLDLGAIPQFEMTTLAYGKGDKS